MCSRRLNVFRWASNAADTIRVALQHLIDLKNSTSSWCNSVNTNILLDQLDLADPSGRLSLNENLPPPIPPEYIKLPMINFAKPHALTKDVTKCNCPDCSKHNFVPMHDTPPANQNSQTANDCVVSVPTRRGAVKKALNKFQKKPSPATEVPATFPVSSTPVKKPKRRFNVTSRYTPGKEQCYIMKSSGFVGSKATFVIQCSKKQSPAYAILIEELCELMEQKVVSEFEAGVWLASKLGLED